MTGIESVETRNAVAFLPLYRRLLGDDLDRLPPAVRRLHDHGGRLCAAGTCRIERGDHPLARLVGWWFAFPSAGENLPVRVCFADRGGVERWERDFAGQALVSEQGELPAQPGLLFERFGAGRFEIEPTATPEGLELSLRGVSFFGLPLPRFLWPEVTGRESVDADGRFTFFVTIRLPVVGLLVHYHGYLVPES